MIVGWDIDGTLCRSYLAGPEFADERELRFRCLPRHVLLARLCAMDVQHVFITGRTEEVRGVTEEQVTKWTGVAEPVVHMQQAWAGYDALRDYKARALREAGCQVYVGDSADDMLAAKAAGVRFVRASMFEKWGLPNDLRAVVA